MTAVPAGDFSREETFSGFVNNGVDSGGLDVPFLSGKTIFSEVAEAPFSGGCSAGTTAVMITSIPSKALVSVQRRSESQKLSKVNRVCSQFLVALNNGN